MVIDFHYHLFAQDLVPQPFWKMMVGFVRIVCDGRGQSLSPEEVATTILPTFWDRDGEQGLRVMADAGIATSVLLPVDHGARMGDAATDIWTYNQHVAALARRYPDRFVAFCAVEPHRASALDLLTAAVEQWGAKGLKLVPNASFSFDEDCVTPLLARLSAWGLPLLTHTGQWPGYGGGTFCHPSRLERILRDFPQLTVVAAHVSGLWWRDLVALAQRYDNLMCDISGLQPGVIENYPRVCSVLRRVLDAFGPHRVLFGSDGPVMDFSMSRADWVRVIARLPEEAPDGMRFTTAELRAVLHDNAARLLGLDPQAG